MDTSWDTTEGFFSRWVVIPFTAFFPAGVADPRLVHRLTSQQSLQGLLRGAVVGLQAVMRRGSFSLPPSVIAATDKFKREADPMRGFIDERVRFHHANDARFCARTDVYMAYTSWASLSGFSPMSNQRFYESFLAAAVDTSQYSIRSTKRDGINGFIGMSLTE